MCEKILIPATAKVFITGNNQAVRLPKSFRLNATEVWITRNETSGEITLKPKPRPDELGALFALLATAPRNADAFVPPRDDSPAADPLRNWDVE